MSGQSGRVISATKCRGDIGRGVTDAGDPDHRREGGEHGDNLVFAGAGRERRGNAPLVGLRRGLQRNNAGQPNESGRPLVDSRVVVVGPGQRGLDRVLVQHSQAT